MKIYVGNLAFNITEEVVRTLFAQHGEVQDVAIATDKATGKSRGFGFVFMKDELQARAAIAALNGRPVQNRRITVSEPLSKEAAAKQKLEQKQKPKGPIGPGPRGAGQGRPGRRPFRSNRPGGQRY